MNIHPLLVHFPIAFFVIYSLFELIPFKKITAQPYWFYIKAVLIFLGVAGALAAGITGNLVEKQYFDQKALISLHSKVNFAASATFSLLAYAYFMTWIRRTQKISANNLLGISLRFENLLLNTLFKYILVLLGFVLIVLGGALGGIIVYGPNLDPFTGFVYSLVAPLVQNMPSGN